MPIEINGQTYYRTAEVCRMVGLSRTTFFRWLKEGTFKESGCRDRRGWRLFTEGEIAAFKAEAHQIVEITK
ncbi:MAG TPA: DNA-binding protein [Dehalococcoidia bacterium]|jgi:predicted site-specific integrase-resolvase|nr:DNA-binding protein [Dehalococcoidia bacterium]